MSSAKESPKSAGADQPLRRVRKLAKRWGRRIQIGLGLVPPPADRGYMICALPRSGSTYFCQLLASTSVLGNPLEYFNPANQRRYFDPKYSVDPHRQIEVVRSRGATRNGIYGVKVTPLHFRYIGEAIDPFRELPNLMLVRLNRRDLLSQAISASRARQTGQYFASEPQARVPKYSQRQIRDCLGALQDQDLVWDGIMQRLALSPPTVAYEDVLRDPQSAVDLVASMMRLSLPAPIKRELITHKVQRDESSNEWRRRFLAETGEEFLQLAGAQSMNL